MHELARIIREEIAREGPIPFSRYMELALYHPTLGYYAGGGQGREPVGWGGDYFTSGDVHPLWGWCIARRLHSMWREMGCPDRFDVVEPGAGRGLLARDVWGYALENQRRLHNNDRARMARAVYSADKQPFRALSPLRRAGRRLLAEAHHERHSYSGRCRRVVAGDCRRRPDLG